MYKLLLIFRYLLKRRIAWVSLAAVMLCTTMVLVVISVMGGWLNMFRESFHGLTGDVIVKSESLAGFPYYDEMIRRIEQKPSVAAAVPVIETYGFFNIGNIPTNTVQVLGYPADKIGRVNMFPTSLYRQHTQIEDELKKPGLTDAQRKALQDQLKEPPSFHLIDRTYAPLAKLPAEIKIDDPKTNEIAVPNLPHRLYYDASGGRLIFRGPMQQDERDLVRGLSENADFKAAIDKLFTDSNNGKIVDYKSILPNAKSDVTNWPGLIPGIGVLYIQRDKDGVWHSPLAPRSLTQNDQGIYGVPVKLTVLGLTPGEGVDISNKAERNYWIVDTSRTQMWQYDNKTVYVPFDKLQLDLGMGPKQAHDAATGAAITLPPRTSQIHVRLKPGANLNQAKNEVDDVVNAVLKEKSEDEYLSSSHPYVTTWEEMQKTWLDAVENEKLLTTMLFSIISVVAVFLIFCIFYMIVVEKTRDIGIIKSVGATSTGVAAIFLGYGLAIGIIGAGMGLLLGYLIIHNINEMHAWLGRAFHVQIWNPEVYLFDKIPNTMNPRDVIVICGIAVLSSVLGALIPAIRAARMNPVEALRWE